MKELKSQETSDFFNVASCIVYDDILYNELHDMRIQTGDLVKIEYSDGNSDIIKVDEIEHGDGTIWVSFHNKIASKV